MLDTLLYLTGQGVEMPESTPETNGGKPIWNLELIDWQRYGLR